MGAFSVVVYVCALRIREVIPFFLEKKDHIYLTGMQAWRQNRRVAVTARSSRAEFVATVVIIGACWLELRTRESATIHNCPR